MKLDGVSIEDAGGAFLVTGLNSMPPATNAHAVNWHRVEAGPDGSRQRAPKATPTG
jgi:hypothetical protein